VNDRDRDGRPCRAHRGAPRRATAVLLLVALSALSAALSGCGWDWRRGRLPASLPDQEFWRLSTTFAEPAGLFAYPDSLISNELYFVHAARMLRPAGGVYIGVGPEQNFTYIARLRPAMAFIVDIRRENRSLHLMYKALFELATDRADYVSRLFSRRPADVDAGTDVGQLFARLGAATPDPRLFDGQLRQIRERLTITRRFPLTAEDLSGIEAALRTFYTEGPGIDYGRSLPDGSTDPSYQELMTAVDVSGQYQSYLGSEESFAVLKELHTRNLILPIVGDFGGARALRSVSDYVRQHNARISAFYASNVEVYLNRRQTDAFCRSLADLPHDSGTWFIGSRSLRPFRTKLAGCPTGALPS
jgi:hypothetical protein